MKFGGVYDLGAPVMKYIYILTSEIYTIPTTTTTTTLCSKMVRNFTTDVYILR